MLSDTDSLDSVSDLVVVIESGRKRTLTHTNPIGEFMFHRVSNGNPDLTSLLEGRRFVVRGLARSDPRDWQLAYSLDGQA